MKIEKQSLKIISVFYMIFFILWCIRFFYNVDLVLLMTYFVLLIYIIRNKESFIIKYLFMIVMFSYHLLSVFIAENSNIYFFNLMQSSSYTGAFFPLLMYYVLFFSIIFLMEKNNNLESRSEYRVNIKFSNFNISEKNKVRLLSFVLILITFYMVMQMKKLGFYSLGGVDRFDFRANNFTGLDEKFYTYISWLLPVPLLAYNIKMKGRALLFFILYIVYLVFVGDKFGSIFIAVYFYFLVTWVTKKINKKKLNKFIISITVIFILFFLFISFQVFYERGSWDEVITYFNNRLTGGQSDLWWSIYNSEKHSGWHISEFINDELGAIFFQPANMLDYNFGIYKMMKVAAPPSVVYAYLSRGIRFAASTQASLFYYFKYFGLFTGAIIFGLCTYYFVNKAVFSYKNNEIIKSVIFTMFISKLIQIMTMSNITVIGDITTIFGLIVLICLHMLKRKSFVKKGM